MRSRSLPLLATLAVAAVVSSAACSGGGGDDDDDGATSPTPVFEADRCQLVWQTDVSTTVRDLYVLDAPVAAWVTGTNHQYGVSSSGFQAGFFGGFDLNTGDAATIAFLTTGSFALVAPSTEAEHFVDFQDDVAQSIHYLDSAGNPAMVAGTGGTGELAGLWSDPYSQNVTPTNGEITVFLEGTAHTIGADLSYGICYTGPGDLFRPAAHARRQR